MWRIDATQLLLALGLDLALGDPRRAPHIARLAGWLAGACEARLTRVTGRGIWAGAIFWLLVNGICLGCLGGAWALVDMAGWNWLAWGIEVAIVYQAVAGRDLWTHARDVERPLLAGDIVRARGRVAMIVGRDTGDLDAGEVTRATLESVGESAVDGWVAPLFWATVAGPAGALVYRVSNTLDSVVGHRDPRYERFGKVSARIDDALNWIPARLLALASAVVTRSGEWRAMAREADAHASPNAGWGEAALARALGVRLGGSNRYAGVTVEGPLFNADAREPEPRDIARGLRWFAGVATATGVLALVTVALVEGMIR